MPAKNHWLSQQTISPATNRTFSHLVRVQVFELFRFREELREINKRLFQSDGLPNASFCQLLSHKMVSAGGASEETLSNFCIFLLQNAMRGAVEKTVPSLLLSKLNIAGSENIEFKAHGKLLPKAGSMIKKSHFEQKSRLLVFDM